MEKGLCTIENDVDGVLLVAASELECSLHKFLVETETIKRRRRRGGLGGGGLGGVFRRRGGDGV